MVIRGYGPLGEVNSDLSLEVNNDALKVTERSPMTLNNLAHQAIKDFNLLEPLKITVSMDTKGYLGIPQLLINVPLTIGCFKLRQTGQTSQGAAEMAAMTPAKCLISCKASGHRIAMTLQGNKCVCHENIPFDEMIPIPDEKCDLPCEGDSQQFCGGQDDGTFLAYVHECEEGWVRFAHHCYKEGLSKADIFENENYCGDAGGHLWSPHSFDDLTFVDLIFGSDVDLHVGWKSFLGYEGVTSVDGRYEPFITFVTHDLHDKPIIDDCENCFSPESCVVYSSKEKKMVMQSPCQFAKGVCQKPLILSYGYQPIGKLLDLSIQDSPSLYSERHVNELPFPARILNESLIPYLEIKANKPFLFSGLQIQTGSENGLKEFKVEYTRDCPFDSNTHDAKCYINSNLMTPLVPPGHNQSVSQGLYMMQLSFLICFFNKVYSVFYGLPKSDNIQREIFWPHPVFTNMIRILPVSCYNMCSFEFDILGQTSMDRYSANPNMEPKESIQSMFLSHNMLKSFLPYFWF